MFFGVSEKYKTRKSFPKHDRTIPDHENFNERPTGSSALMKEEEHSLGLCAHWLIRISTTVFFSWSSCESTSDELPALRNIRIP